MFYAYALLLTLSGIAMLVMALVRADYAKRRQVVNFVLGAGFTIYGLYLLLAFQGGHYVLFYYVFALPIVMIIQFFRARAAAKSQQASPGQPFNYAPGQAYNPAPGQPYNQAAGQGYGYAYNQAPQQSYNPAQQQGYAPQQGYNQPPQAYNQGFGQAPASYPPAAPWPAGPETSNGQPTGYPQEPNRDRW